MDWFSKEYSKSVINYKIKPTNEEDINFIENIFTHKHDNAVITMDSELKNNGSTSIRKKLHNFILSKL